MKLFVIALLIAVMPIAMCSAKEKADDWYGMVDGSAGMLQDLKTGETEVYACRPVGGYRAARFDFGFVFDEEDKLLPKAAVLGMTFHLGNARDWGIDAGWAEYISVSVGPYFRYGFQSEQVSIGVGATLLEVAFGGGGVKEQKQR